MNFAHSEVATLDPTTMGTLCEEYMANNYIDPETSERLGVKRGLRNADGSGVVAGLTRISDVHGYNKVDGKVVPDQGKLTLRGYSIEDLVNNAQAENRYGYEEVAYLLITGSLPNKEELDGFCERLGAFRHLSDEYVKEFPMTTVSSSIMNVLQRAVLLLYAFDAEPDVITPEHEIDVAISMLARLPRIAAFAHMASVAKRRGSEVHVPHPTPGLSTAETILQVLRGGMAFTRDEAMLLDVMLMLHAEHGGGNNSTFVCRALSSSGTDTYSAIAGAVGSLKGPLHGGANAKVMEMFHYIQENVDPHDDGSIRDYLVRLLDGEAGDCSGKLYGLGHAVYTMSDPRAVLLKKYARHIAQIKGYEAEFDLLQKVEELGIPLVQERRHSDTPMCANVDMYSGLVYTMLGIPEDVFTPLFASARIAGWCANRMEEVITGHRIMRPAYRAVTIRGHYVPMEERTSRIKEFDL